MCHVGRTPERANILRDIDKDAAQGRGYIAGTTIERFGPPPPGQRQEPLRRPCAWSADCIYGSS
jgi:phytoene/squalene synthetase